METAREFYYRKINPDKMANQIIHETIINLMEEYAQEVAKNLHKPLVIKSVCVNHGERTYNEETGIVYCSLCKRPC